MDGMPGQVEGGGGVNPSADVVITEPRPGSPVKEEVSIKGFVGLEELAKTDRILVQQLAEYVESCTCGYEGENEFEVTDRFGHQIFLAEEDSSCCFRQCCESLRGFSMNLTDRQGKVAIVIDRPLRCDNCCLCPCMTQTMSVECPPGVVAGHVEQSLSIFTPTYIIKDAQEQDVFVVEGPTNICTCIKTLKHCCASRDIVFRILDLKTDKQVGSISKKWNGVLKEVLTKADRFSIDFPTDIDIGMKATLLGMTFLIDYLHFEADPTDAVTDEIA